MTGVIVTTADARALMSLIDYIEGRFRCVEMPSALLRTSTAHPPGTAVTLEPFTQLTSTDWASSRDEVIAAARAAFDAYAKDKVGTLYWRVPPEIAEGKDFATGQGGWRFYMRLLISDKAAQ
jgi:hypothetical protein